MSEDIHRKLENVIDNLDEKIEELYKYSENLIKNNRQIEYSNLIGKIWGLRYAAFLVNNIRLEKEKES